MLLEVTHLDVAYGDVQVLWDVSFSVEEGKIIAVVGANGAGKSTLLKTISGVKAPRDGEIRFRGERIDTLHPHEVVQRGIIQVPEGRKLFAEMTVEENLLMGAYHRRRTRKSPPTWSMSTNSSRGSRSGGGRRRAASPAGSSRWWPSAAA